jgi:hypothetical protein
MRTALLKDWTGPPPFKYGKLERKFLFGGEHMNPMNLLQLKPAWNQFKANHPKMLSFVKAASRDGVMDEGTLIEITVTSSTGQTIASNIRVKKSDLEFLGALKDALED